jgi:hypothetical protein
MVSLHWRCWDQHDTSPAITPCPDLPERSDAARSRGQGWPAWATAGGGAQTANEIRFPQSVNDRLKLRENQRFEIAMTV